MKISVLGTDLAKHVFQLHEALLHDASRSRSERLNVGLCNAETIGHPEMSHSVQDHAGERRLRLLRRHGATAHRATNDRFVSRHRRLHQAAPCVA